jgi:class 3 adenylate cyclase
MAEAPTGTVTLLFSDIEGSTRLLQQTGDAYADLLSEHRRLLGEAFERHNGFHVDSEGDAFGHAAADRDAERRPWRAPFGRSADERAHRPAAPADDEADQDAGRHLDPERRVDEEAERRAPAPVEDARGLAHGVEEGAVSVRDIVGRFELLVLERR